MTGVFIQRDGTCTSAATDKPAPCCYTDANGSSCHCQRAKVAEAALATARADALRSVLAKMGWVSPSPVTHNDFDMGYMQARDEVTAAILALIPQEPKP